LFSQPFASIHVLAICTAATSASARVRQAALDVSAREAEIELEFVSGWDMP